MKMTTESAMRYGRKYKYAVHFLLPVLMFCCFNTLITQAQDTTYTRGECTDKASGMLSAASNSMTAALVGLDGIPSCCPEYKTGTGITFSGGGEYQHLLSKQLSIGARVGFGILSGALVSEERKSTLNNGIEEIATIEHRISSTITDMIFTPFVEYSIIERIPLRLGMTARYNLTTNFVQSEKILAPSTLVFENNRRDRLNYSGSIPSLNTLRFDGSVGIGYIIPLSSQGNWRLAPQAEIAIPLNSIVQNGMWKIASFGVSLALQYEFHSSELHITPAPPAPPTPAPPPPKPAPRLIASISLRMKQDGPKEFNLTLQSKTTNTAFPLLPYIFFDDSSSVLAARYKQLTPEQAEKFTFLALDNLPDLDRYCHVLNIIGKRLTEYPATTITIVGCNSNTGSELNNKQLSMRRAESVKNYLLSIWKIDEKRITLESRNLPVQFSNPKTGDGIEENRRVEIIPSSTDLYVPVFVNDTSFTASQPNFFAVPDVVAEAGVRNWTLRFMQSGKELWIMHGTGTVPQSVAIPMNDTTAPRFGNELQLQLEVIDNNGKTVSANDKVGVSFVQDSSIERKQFTLVLFDFNSSALTTLNKRVAAMIKDQIKPNSRVNIIGFADRSGNKEYNRKLALRRGSTLAQTLESKDAELSAYDGDVLMNNDLPEGRYFCRTVRLVIEDKR